MAVLGSALGMLSSFENIDPAIFSGKVSHTYSINMIAKSEDTGCNREQSMSHHDGDDIASICESSSSPITH